MRPKMHQRPLRILFFVGIVVVFLVFMTGGVGERALHTVQRPLVSLGTWIYKGSLSFRTQNISPKEIDELKQRTLDLAIDQAELRELQKENALLKTALGFIARQDLRVVTASIIARSQTTQESLFLIDRGSQDGIHVGDPVIVREGVLIGKVVRVTAKSSTIHMLSDPSVATAVSLLNQTQTIGIAEGMSGNLLRLKFIPQETVMHVNDLVVSSGLEAGVPPGLFVGLVNEVHPEQNAPFLEAIIEPLVDMREFTIVHVLTHNVL